MVGWAGGGRDIGGPLREQLRRTGRRASCRLLPAAACPPRRRSSTVLRLSHPAVPWWPRFPPHCRKRSLDGPPLRARAARPTCRARRLRREGRGAGRAGRGRAMGQRAALQRVFCWHCVAAEHAASKQRRLTAAAAPGVEGGGAGAAARHPAAQADQLADHGLRRCGCKWQGGCCASHSCLLRGDDCRLGPRACRGGCTRVRSLPRSCGTRQLRDSSAATLYLTSESTVVSGARLIYACKLMGY